MPAKTENVSQADNAVRKRQAAQPAAQDLVLQQEQIPPLTMGMQGAILDPGRARPANILALQRIAGNRAVSRLIQAKLTVGPVGDRYEQEADRVAEQVLTMPLPSPSRRGTGGEVQRQDEDEEIQAKPLAATISPLLQRQEEEEDLQMKPVVAQQVVQRQEEEEDLQASPLVQRQEEEEDLQASPLVQRQEEEEDLQAKPLVQRQEEEEDLQASPLVQRQEEEEDLQTSPLVQRQEEEEEDLQAKPLVQRQDEEEDLQASPLVQRQEEEEDLQASALVQRQAGGGFEAGPELEGRLAARKGSGSPLSEETRAFMEPRFGTDFSGVRVHSGGEAGQMSKELKAQAFTHGQDIYLGAGQYDPGTTAGKRLLAHELTHVVQQTGPQVQRQGANDGGLVLQRKLISRADRAFKTAAAQNTAYSTAKDLTDQHVTEKEQKELVTLRGKWARILKSPGPEKLLKDFIRAFLLRNFVAIITDPNKTRGRKFYLGKAKEERDKYKGLVSKGVTAPETQTWLRSQGFTAGITVEQKDLQVGPRIDVRATFIGGRILGKRVRAHTFIVYTTSTGRQYYFRGGPSGGSPSLTVADFGEYTPNTVDWDPSAPSKTVMKGEGAKGKLDGLIEAASIIDDMQVPYRAGGMFESGENCNATAYTILKRAGVPTGKPSGTHPGWGHILGAETKGKENAMPAKEDLSGPGEAYQIKGPTGDEVQVYKDRMRIEESAKIAGGTPVGLMMTFGNQSAMIKYGDEKIGFVLRDQLGIRREVGRKFKINTACDVYAVDSLATIGSLDPGDVVDVLDPDFEEGAFGTPIRIAFEHLEEYRIGRVSDWYLEKVT
jgi:hypothetical protein